MTEIMRFGIVGLVATAVHFAILTLGVEHLSIPATPANGLAFLCALSITYLGQSLWVFHERSRHGPAQMMRFAVSLAIGLLANMAAMAACVHVLGLGYRAGFVLGLVVVPALSFVINRFWVFRNV
ncbi:GtrA family protein [Paracoccus sp. YIM 132242]|uniref:GtrA family protein n=1 Tax=Paracoccus lichenicola TaxID=2665644 RepID=A0A6L6HRN2_9RHOB|nr:GtrA family protein [Paracoccus lichenicola]MTE01767.1 GtrA family protein [Paracoccus lichenicola]